MMPLNHCREECAEQQSRGKQRAQRAERVLSSRAGWREPSERCESDSSACASLVVCGCCFMLHMCVIDVFEPVHFRLFVNRLTEQPSPFVSLVCTPRDCHGRDAARRLRTSGSRRLSGGGRAHSPRGGGLCLWRSTVQPRVERGRPGPALEDADILSPWRTRM